jgi:PGF-CTERM protein
MRRTWVVLAVGVVAVVAASAWVGAVAAAPATTQPNTADAPNATPTPEDEANGVSVDANATYSLDDSVRVTVGGQQRNLYVVYLYDDDGSRVALERAPMTGENETFDFGTLPSGSYRVVVVEAQTGTHVSRTFGVDGAYQSGVVPEVTVDEPADVVSVPVTLPNGTSRATVVLEGDRGAYRVEATVVDHDGDGEVVLDWNTFYAGRGAVALHTIGADAVVNATRARDLDGFLREGEYHLTVRANGQTLDHGAIVVDLEPLHTSQVDVYEAPDRGSPAASLAAGASTDRVEADEWLFVVVHSQGVFGAVNATRDLRSVGPDQVVLSIVPEDGGEGVRLTDADYVSVEEGRIVVGFAPESEALSVGTQYDVDFRITRAHPYRGGDELTSVMVQVVPAGSEPDAPAFDIESVNAPERVPADGVANFTVTLFNRGERAGRTTVSVTIGGHDTEREVTVPGNGRATVELAFDTARVLQGTREYVVEANDLRATGTLVVGDDRLDDGPTLRDRDDDNALPGFGPLTALAALAAVLATARHRSE